MAGCDYKSCDVCGMKTFYDAHLDYNFEHEPLGLYNLGDWKVICTECAKTYEVRLFKKRKKDRK